ncbi:uncharacterized protein LOC143470435 [Clavelina lepadiformis]|uniref:uncharacterized protein LOC143470435 n=1 Tax=Clavelina lepadiformis TaxID=159417 RepID=UPI004041A0F8
MKVRFKKTLKWLKYQIIALSLFSAFMIFIYKRMLNGNVGGVVLHVNAEKFFDNPLLLSEIVGKDNLDNKRLNLKSSLIETYQANQNHVYDNDALNSTKVRQRRSTNCSLWGAYPNQLITSLASQIKLNPKNFLYPGLFGGPNNQLMGLLQSIFVAIRLNRTLVVPKFSTHHYTFGSVQIVPAFQRINIQRLCSFVSCISIDDFRKTCSGFIDVVFQAREVTAEHIRRFERETEMSILRGKSTKLSSNTNGAVNLNLSAGNILVYPNSSLYSITRDHWLSTKDGGVQRVYNSKASCTLHALSYRSVEVLPKGAISFPLFPNAGNVKEIPDDLLYSAVIDSVRLPRCITAAAEDYIRSVISDRDYVALHWRYNKEDWFKSCQRPEKQTMCEALKKVTAEDVAKAIVDNLPPLQIENVGVGLRTRFPVYIATPPGLIKFKREVLEHMKRLNPFLQGISKELDDYLNEAGFAQCWQKAGWVSHDDIVSLIEMEIARKSKYFFYSVISSWSKNIRPLRWEWNDGKINKLYEASIVELITNIKIDPNSKTENSPPLRV